MLLGHSNKIFTKSVNQQKNKGSNYSCSNINNDNFKKKIFKTFNNFFSIYFCNSGSEANIRALRIARCLTKKKKFRKIAHEAFYSYIRFLVLQKNKKTFDIRKFDWHATAMDFGIPRLIQEKKNH